MVNRLGNGSGLRSNPQRDPPPDPEYRLRKHRQEEEEKKIRRGEVDVGFIAGLLPVKEGKSDIPKVDEQQDSHNVGVLWGIWNLLRRPG